MSVQSNCLVLLAVSRSVVLHVCSIEVLLQIAGKLHFVPVLEMWLQSYMHRRVAEIVLSSMVCVIEDRRV